MRFPESPRAGTEAHKLALRRLDEAVADQHCRTEAHDAAKGTPEEPGAANELAGANEQVAAREAWVEWVERGY